MLGLDEVKDRLQETYKSRKCDWCHKSCKDCDPKCQCLYCRFPDSYDSLDGDYQTIKDWIMENLKFYEKLYKKGLGAVNILMRKWHNRQLFTLEKTGTRIIDWVLDSEVIGVKRTHHAPPEGYEMITPYYDHRHKKDLKLNYCQICGRDLKYNYYIKHEEKKQCVKIGHECAEAFCLADLIIINLKKHMREVIRAEFKRLKPHLIQSIEKKTKRKSKNQKKLLDALERITKHFDKKSPYKIPPHKIAELLLELKGYGIDIIYQENSSKTTITSIPSEQNVFSEQITEKNTLNDNPEELKKKLEIGDMLDKNISKFIFEKMKKLRGIHGDMINDDKLIQEMENCGLTRDEIIGALQGMEKRNEIYKFIPHYYKIRDELN